MSMSKWKSQFLGLLVVTVTSFMSIAQARADFVFPALNCRIIQLNTDGKWAHVTPLKRANLDEIADDFQTVLIQDKDEASSTSYRVTAKTSRREMESTRGVSGYYVEISLESGNQLAALSAPLTATSKAPVSLMLPGNGRAVGVACRLETANVWPVPAGHP